MTNEQNHSSLTLNNNDESTPQLKDSITRSVEIQPARSMTCYICLENISAMHKQFGIQNNCDHFFCFDCLSTWRRTGDRETGGRCPLCRTRSTFIAPSYRCFNNSADKQMLIDSHKLRLKTIPCRTLLRYGTCRFAHRCYYSHRIPFVLFSSGNEQQDNSSSISRDNTIEPTNEDNNDIRQEPPRRITYNSYRYRPY